MSKVSPAVVAMVERDLDELSEQAQRQLGDVAGVAVTMATPDDGPVTVGASTELAREVDRVQFHLGAGPCLTALHGGGGNYVPDLAADPRWEEYGRAAAERGVRCCVSVPVVEDGDVLAVVKVYSTKVDGLSEEQRRAADRLADEVVGRIALARSFTVNARELDDRTAAMDSRRTIDLALGVVMERARCTPEAAFELLKQQSQHRNVRLADVAREVVAEFGGSAGPVAPFEGRRSRDTSWDPATA